MKSAEQITNEIHEIARAFSTRDYSKPYISILQPRRTFKETPAQQLQNSHGRQIDLTAMSVAFHAIDGNPVDTAYNWLFSKALEDDAKYALCIEEDTVLPWDGAVKLLQTSEQFPDAIIVGVYYIKFGGQMISDLDENGRWKRTDITPNTGLRRNIKCCGLGCALIPLHLVRRIQEKYPEIPLFCVVPAKCWNDETITEVGQDTWFYHLADTCGIEVICDTSVQCLHMELATGKYTAHPDVKLGDYVTQIPISGPLTLEDRARVSKDYIERMNRPDWSDKGTK